MLNILLNCMSVSVTCISVSCMLKLIVLEVIVVFKLGGFMLFMDGISGF